MYTSHGMVSRLRWRPGGCSFPVLHIFQLVSGYTFSLTWRFPPGSVCSPVKVAAHVWSSVREPRSEDVAWRTLHELFQAQVDLRGPHDVVLVFAATESSMFPLSLSSYISRGHFSRVHSCVSPPHLSNSICPHSLRASLRPRACRRNLPKLN